MKKWAYEEPPAPSIEARATSAVPVANKSSCIQERVETANGVRDSVIAVASGVATVAVKVAAFTNQSTTVGGEGGETTTKVDEGKIGYGNGPKELPPAKREGRDCGRNDAGVWAAAPVGEVVSGKNWQRLESGDGDYRCSWSFATERDGGSYSEVVEEAQRNRAGQSWALGPIGPRVAEVDVVFDSVSMSS